MPHTQKNFLADVRRNSQLQAYETILWVFLVIAVVVTFYLASRIPPSPIPRHCPPLGGTLMAAALTMLLATGIYYLRCKRGRLQSRLKL